MYTGANLRSIHLKYYEYLVNVEAQRAGVSLANVTPAQLEPYWIQASEEYEKYEMYVKKVATVDPNAMVNEGPPPVQVSNIPIEDGTATDADIMGMHTSFEGVLAALGDLRMGGKNKRNRRTRNRH